MDVKEQKSLAKRMKNKGKFPLVYVEWYDAVSNDEWMSEDEMKIWGERYSDFVVYQTGWLIEKNAKYILLASRYNESSERVRQWGMIEKIPKTWCKIIRLLK